MCAAAYIVSTFLFILVANAQNQCWNSGCALYSNGDRCGQPNIELEKMECCNWWDTQVNGKRCGYCCSRAADCKHVDDCIPLGCINCPKCPDDRTEPNVKHSSYGPKPCKLQYNGMQFEGKKYFCCKKV